MNWRGPRASMRTAVAVWGCVRVLQISVLGWGTGSEPGLFLHYAQQWVAGARLSFQPEYPPAVLPFLLLPLVVGGAGDYARAFALEMACFDLVPAVLVLAALYALHRRELGVSAILLGVAGAVKLWPFALASCPCTCGRHEGDGN